jgi:hypothetical protein
MLDLKKAVLSKIEEVGPSKASELFGVSTGTISNWLSGRTPPSLTAAQLVMDEQPVASESVEKVVEWEGRDVAILLPCYRSFNPKTHFTLFANYARYGPEKLALEMKERTVIHEARNILIDKAYNNTKATKFIMGDDDMILPCGSPGLLNTKYRAKLPEDLAKQVAISRLLSHGEEYGIIGSLYFGRSESGRAQCESGFASDDENAKFHKLGYRGLKKEHWVGTGLIKIERWVIDKMKAAVEEGRWPECKRDDPNSYYGYFNPIRVRTGEDVSFCRRAADIGIQTYLDTSLVCGHADGNHIFWHHNTLAK